MYRLEDDLRFDISVEDFVDLQTSTPIKDKGRSRCLSLYDTETDTSDSATPPKKRTPNFVVMVDDSSLDSMETLSDSSLFNMSLKPNGSNGDSNTCLNLNDSTTGDSWCESISLTTVADTSCASSAGELGKKRSSVKNFEEIISLVDDESIDDTYIEEANSMTSKAQEIISLVDDDDDDTYIEEPTPMINKPKDIKVRSDLDILWLFTVHCCEKKCLRQLSLKDINYIEVHLKERKQTSKRNYVLDFLQQHSKINELGDYETEFIVRGRHVCREAWLLSHNLSKESFRRTNNTFKEGVAVIEHGNKGKQCIRPKTSECIAWLQFFIKSIGDYQPDNKSIHLPSCFSKIDVYRKMLEENNRFNHPTVSLSHFYALWDKHFKHVVIPRENRFTKCTDCTKYKAEKEATVDSRRRAEIDQLLQLHMELVWQERRVYYLHRYKSRRFPAKYLANIDDGMDQHTTNIPNLRRLSKAMSSLTTVGTHLVGAIIHNGQAQNGKEIYGSFDYYQWPHDSNLTVTVLLDVLVKWSEVYQLPPVLYLQFDNCTRENKNQFMFGLLALLIENNIFEKIRVNFLPVGHTHEDIDAFFGVFSKHLDRLDVYTIEELFSALETSMANPVPKPFMLPKVYDVKSWISGHTVELHEHTAPKCFKFKLNSQNKCEMFYRKWSHEKWHGPVVILKSMPLGKPQLVTPTLAKLDVEALQRDIPKYKNNMPSGAYNSWKEWLENVESIQTVPEDYDWPFIKLKQAARTEQLPPPAQIPTTLLELRETEIEPTREIYTGRYRNPRERVEPIEVNDNYLDNLQEGCFVAMYFVNYDKTPVIGKVLNVDENHFEVHYWKGTYLGKWSPQHLPRKTAEPWVEMLPKSCILCCSFELTDGNKLLPSTRNFLKDRYSALRSQILET